MRLASGLVLAALAVGVTCSGCSGGSGGSSAQETYLDVAARYWGADDRQQFVDDGYQTGYHRLWIGDAIKGHDGIPDAGGVVLHSQQVGTQHVVLFSLGRFTGEVIVNGSEDDRAALANRLALAEHEALLAIS